MCQIIIIICTEYWLSNLFLQCSDTSGLVTGRHTACNKVRYCKQITYQHLYNTNFWPRPAAWLWLFFPLSTLITMQNLATLSHTISMHVGGLQKLETLGPHSLRMEVWLPARNTPFPSLHYHIKYGRSMSNCMGISKGVPKIWGCWSPANLGWGLGGP